MDLEPGVTVVVGPNGSGKSNVVDAVAWVLGAQAPKAVRSQKMDDVIFAGTAKRSALGRAEVSLTLDNSAGLLPLEFTEVTVTRVLFRNGDSEYSINGVPCRLLDVQELLSDAGVGRQQHVIVSQGQIDSVLNARPEDRRSIIEEAAGVLKYRKRREKAQRRLDATEANLVRLQDLLREVRRQLKPLERQAHASQRYVELQAELDKLRMFVAGREIATQRAKLVAIENDRIQASEVQNTSKTRLAELDTSIMGIEAQLSAGGANDVRDRLGNVERLIERADGLLGIIDERRRSLERDRSQGLDADVIATLEADVAGFRSELAEVEAGLADLQPEVAALEEEERQLEAEREAAEHGGVDLSSKAATAAAEVRGELRSVRSSLERSRSERDRAVERVELSRGQLVELVDEIDRYRNECETAANAEEPLVRQHATAEAERVATENAFAEAERLERDASSEVERLKARQEALQLALDSARARAGAERLAGLEGVLGTLLDVIAIDSGWESAIEAALGEALSAVVVESAPNARTAIEALRTSATSGAVLAAISGPSVEAEVPSGCVSVLGHVRATNPGVQSLLERLLSQAVSAPSLDAAIDAALSHHDLVIVTPAGDRLSATGWRIGSSSAGATVAALEEVGARVNVAMKTLEAAKTARAGARTTLDQAQSSEREFAAALDRNDGRFLAASEALAHAQARRREVDAEREGAERSIAEFVSAIEVNEQRLSELEAALPTLIAAEQAEADAVRQRDESRATIDAWSSLLVSKRRDVEVRSAGLNEQQEFLHRRIADIDGRLEADSDAQAAAAGRREQVERALGAVGALRAFVEERRIQVIAARDSLAQERQRQSVAVTERTEHLDQLRQERSVLEIALEDSRERLTRAEISEAEVKLRLETTIELLRRDLDIEPEVAEAAEPPEVPEGATPAGRVRELERELRLLGPINPLALEEFNELSQRHEFLEGQLEDVRSTRRELNRVIAAVDVEIQNVFASAFADVSSNFAQLFGALFPGGNGALKLTAPDDLLNTGIEVEAKPSGKNVKKLSLLSGGERSLTALAFLFAVFRSRPSPFYVMDEVEAALDDVNLHRFLNLGQEFRKEAQLLIVSHQKRTMEAGDALLGVSMQPGGSSRVVTERVSAAANN